MSDAGEMKNHSIASLDLDKTSREMSHILLSFNYFIIQYFFFQECMNLYEFNVLLFIFLHLCLLIYLLIINTRKRKKKI